MPLPTLSLEEKRKALRKAQRVRSERAKLRQDLKAGRTTIREVLEQVDNDVIAKMRVAYLVESLPRIGKIRTRKIMNENGIDETRRVQGLGSRQKQALLERLGNH